MTLRLIGWLMVSCLWLPAAHGFEVEGEGKVLWVADGDTFVFRPDDSQMWQSLKRRARHKQARTKRRLRINDRFNQQDKSILVRVGNVDAAEDAPPGRGKSSA